MLVSTSTPAGGFVDLAQRVVLHNSSPNSAVHGAFDAKKTVISRWDLTTSRGTKSIARASKTKVPLMPCCRLLVLPGPFHSYHFSLSSQSAHIDCHALFGISVFMDVCRVIGHVAAIECFPRKRRHNPHCHPPGHKDESTSAAANPPAFCWASLFWFVTCRGK